MHRTVLCVAAGIALCFPASPADRKSWNKIRYVGGTIPVKTSPYDWNTTLTVVAPPVEITVSIATATVPITKRVVRLKPSQVNSLSMGPVAWKRVAAVPGALLPSKPPQLFGLLQESDSFGIVFEAEDGKPAAMLLESPYSGMILTVLRRLTGKNIEDLP
jgi:hypothetical protein